MTRQQQSRETASAQIRHDADRPVLVTGATGQQGGAVLRHLRMQGFAVRALTRDLHSPVARTPAATGVDVIQGNFDNRTSLERALDGYGADLPTLHAIYPALTTLEQWLRRTGWQGAAAGAAMRHT